MELYVRKRGEMIRSDRGTCVEGWKGMHLHIGVIMYHAMAKSQRGSDRDTSTCVLGRVYTHIRYLTLEHMGSLPSSYPVCFIVPGELVRL